MYIQHYTTQHSSNIEYRRGRYHVVSPVKDASLAARINGPKRVCRQVR